MRPGLGQRRRSRDGRRRRVHGPGRVDAPRTDHVARVRADTPAGDVAQELPDRPRAAPRASAGRRAAVRRVGVRSVGGSGPCSTSRSARRAMPVAVDVEREHAVGGSEPVVRLRPGRQHRPDAGGVRRRVVEAVRRDRVLAGVVAVPALRAAAHAVRGRATRRRRRRSRARRTRGPHGCGHRTSGAARQPSSSSGSERKVVGVSRRRDRRRGDRLRLRRPHRRLRQRRQVLDLGPPAVVDDDRGEGLAADELVARVAGADRRRRPAEQRGQPGERLGLRTRRGRRRAADLGAVLEGERPVAEVTSLPALTPVCGKMVRGSEMAVRVTS